MRKKSPKGSANMKSSEKGIGMSIHKFSFSQIFGPQTSQSELFEDAVKSQMSDFLDGKDALIFSYGVTNAGKTYTIQGTPKDRGILLRVLDSTFQRIEGHQYEGMDLKPYLRNDVQCLNPDQVKQEKSLRAAILAAFKEVKTSYFLYLLTFSENKLTSVAFTNVVVKLINSYLSSCFGSYTQNSDVGQFALWVAFFEIYNECVYDLLQLSLCSKSKKRAALRVCDDGAGNAYVKDLRWINVHNLSEACKILQYGNKNRSAAATKMNQSSSRSHSIFTMKLLKTDGDTVKSISEFSLCDLAGSERCNKTKTFGERLKEAANINNSLLILGKCITALRNNQTDSYIPFRESKLTKLFQTFFIGKGRASMIVNINQCASTYDETLHVMKFSAVAKQVVQVIPDKNLESLSPCLVGRDGKPLVKNGVIDSEALESYLSEEELLDEEEEADVSLLPQKVKLLVHNLRTKLLAERRRNLVQEVEIRKEMGDAMLQQLMESEELRSREIEELKETYQEKLENTFEMYKDAIKEHAYQSAMRNLEDDYVPLDEFMAEQEKVEVSLKRDGIIIRLVWSCFSIPFPSCPSCGTCKTIVLKPFLFTGDDRYKRLYKEKCAIERMCEDKQESLCFPLQAKSMDGMLRQIIEKDREITSLKAELEKLSQKSPVLLKTKKGLLANLKEAVISPRKEATTRTLRKTMKTAHR
uniref:Kinesin-like protein n=1 Tax=Sphaeramia orbicularis TaxID=375764 RepID=A0A673CDK0_9TELE